MVLDGPIGGRSNPAWALLQGKLGGKEPPSPY